MSSNYNMTFEESQDYISRREFDIPWNDCDVFVDERYITETVGNVLKWADENPSSECYTYNKEKWMDKLEKWLMKYFVEDHYGMSPSGFGVFMYLLRKGMEE